MFTDFEVITKSCSQKDKELLFVKHSDTGKFAVVVYDTSGGRGRWRAGEVEGEDLESVVNWVDREMAEECFDRCRTT